MVTHLLDNLERCQSHRRLQPNALQCGEGSAIRCDLRAQRGTEKRIDHGKCAEHLLSSAPTLLSSIVSNVNLVPNVCFCSSVSGHFSSMLKIGSSVNAKNSGLARVCVFNVDSKLLGKRLRIMQASLFIHVQKHTCVPVRARTLKNESTSTHSHSTHQKDFRDNNFRKIAFNRSTKARSSIKHLYYVVISCHFRE